MLLVRRRIASALERWGWFGCLEMSLVVDARKRGFPRESLGSRLLFGQMKSSGNTFDLETTPKLTITLEPFAFDIQRCLQLADPSIRMTRRSRYV